MAKSSTSFKPGQSGNPNGRPPKGYSISEWFKNMLNSNPDVLEKIGNSILDKAINGDIAAQRLIWNYLDGMPPQDITSGGEKLESLNAIFAKANIGTDNEVSE